MGGSMQPVDPAREKRAIAKQDLVNLTSGAKEKLDTTIVGMKGAAHMMTHPFSKEAKEEAKVKTIEEKQEVVAKQAGVREAAQQMVVEETRAARGEALPLGAGQNVQGDDAQAPVDSDQPALPREQREGAPEPSPSRGVENELSAPSYRDDPSNKGEGYVADVDEAGSNLDSDSSDGSAQVRAKIPPTNEDYRSG